jgi:adenosylcobyric acid synthase
MKTLMIQGTSSHAGKSVLVAALLRVLKNKGINCAPFKPQNMALNSFVTYEGHEIGRAQAMQAEAAKVPPTYRMNPVLLKPTTDSRAQVVVNGKPWKNLSAREYVNAKKYLKGAVSDAFQYLTENFDAVIVEGAGSPAEINLRKNDIANMGFARMFDIPVIIVGDIDRGGIYASFYGTYALLTPAERVLIKGFLINKFRGDVTLLKDANDYILRRTKLPVLGVIPYFTDITISDEDGVSLSDINKKAAAKSVTAENMVKVRIIKLPRISNFTDFEPLFLEPGVDISYVSNPREAAGAHLVIIPGSKNTIEDLLFLRESGFEKFLKGFVAKGGFLTGICGGYQMLGKRIKDPFGVESSIKEIAGTGFLDISTVLERQKQLKQVRFGEKDGRVKDMKGYEIHMGITDIHSGDPVFKISNPESPIPSPQSRVPSPQSRVPSPQYRYDGLTARRGRIFGTYIHGLFDNDKFRLKFLNNIREANGMVVVRKTYNYEAYKNSAYDRLAELFERSVDMKRIMKLLGI